LSLVFSYVPLKLAPFPSSLAAAVAALPSISEIPFLGSCVPDHFFVVFVSSVVNAALQEPDFSADPAVNELSRDYFL
jgi:hypothetical protein